MEIRINLITPGVTINEDVERAFKVELRREYLSRCPASMCLKGLACRVPTAVHSDACLRPTAQDPRATFLRELTYKSTNPGRVNTQ